MIAQAQQRIDAGLAVAWERGLDRGVRHEPGADEGVRRILNVMRTVDRSASRPPSRTILKLRRLRSSRARGSLPMNTRRELFNPTRADAKAKLELRRKEELRAQSEKQCILERVGDRLEFITDRRVRSLQQREALTRIPKSSFIDSLGLCTIGQRTRAHDVSNDSVPKSHNTTLFLVHGSSQAPSWRNPANYSASHDTSRQTYFNHDVNSIAT